MKNNYLVDLPFLSIFLEEYGVPKLDSTHKVDENYLKDKY